MQQRLKPVAPPAKARRPGALEDRGEDRLAAERGDTLVQPLRRETAGSLSPTSAGSGG